MVFFVTIPLWLGITIWIIQALVSSNSKTIARTFKAPDGRSKTYTVPHDEPAAVTLARFEHFLGPNPNAVDGSWNNPSFKPGGMNQSPARVPAPVPVAGAHWINPRHQMPTRAEHEPKATPVQDAEPAVLPSYSDWRLEVEPIPSALSPAEPLVWNPAPNSSAKWVRPRFEAVRTAVVAREGRHPRSWDANKHTP